MAASDYVPIFFTNRLHLAATTSGPPGSRLGCDRELCSFPALQVAISLASATVTSMRGLRASICSSHEPVCSPEARRRCCRWHATIYLGRE